MSYVVSGLPLEPFQALFGLPDEALAARGVLRQVADTPVGYPCRITLEDAPVGESVLLLNYEHQPADTPFRSRHAIYVRERATSPARVVGRAPPALALRKLLALRVFDAGGMLRGAEVVPGSEIEAAIPSLLARDEAAYLHVHNAGLGCYLARVDPAEAAVRAVQM